MRIIINQLKYSAKNMLPLHNVKKNVQGVGETNKMFE